MKSLAKAAHAVAALILISAVWVSVGLVEAQRWGARSGRPDAATITPPAPLAPLTLAVNSTADTSDSTPGDGLCLTAGGVCTLRAAIEEANAAADADTINFAIPAATDSGCNAVTGVCTISPASALPTVTSPVTIDGYTQPLASQNTLAAGDNAAIKIELNGASAGAGADGLSISAGSSTVRGLAVYKFSGDGVDLNASGSNTVSGNFIGTNSTGTASGLGNSGDGVNIAGGSNTVGGSTPAARNVISANSVEGVDISGAGATGNTIAGNYIGTDKNGTADLGNINNGVSLAAPSNTVGGSTATPGQGAGNVISGNTLAGVRITTANGTGNTVAGNLIGLQAGGTAARANDLEGVFIANGASSNTVGGTTSDLRNVISGNNTVPTPAASSTDGVEISGAGTNSNKVQGNYIGTNLSGTAALANADGVKITNGAQSNTVGGLTPTPGTAPGNVISGNGSDGVEMDGSSTLATAGNTVAGNLIGLQPGGTAVLRNTSNGVFIDGAASNTVGGSTSTARNVITAGTATTSDGVDIQSETADNNTVAGNYVGTDITGTLDLGAGGDGVRISSGPDNNTIGGPTSTPGAAPGNVISGNGAAGCATCDGVEIAGSTTTGNKVQGNVIGLKANGTEALPNSSDGVRVSSGATTTTVGGTASGARNVISGNGSHGIELNAGGQTVQGNYIGTQAGGSAALANAGHGVAVASSSNAVGGAAAGAGNTIAFNGGDGVYVASGVANDIRRNSIHSNTGLGIDLGTDGVTPNDTDDPDAGANNLQNFPVITSAMQGSTVVQGTLNSTPSTAFTIEFFSSTAADPSGNGEGQTYLDSITVTTDAGGDAAFTHTVATTVPVGNYVTATATDPSGNTSEFSNARYVLSSTLARVREATATAYDAGVVLEWRTDYEVDNLGFNVYREVGGVRTLVNPSLVAGSALVAGTGSVMTAGNSYAWLDADGNASALYWLEDVDTLGRTTMHGPYAPVQGAAGRPAALRQPPLLSQLGGATTPTREVRPAQPYSEAAVSDVDITIEDDDGPAARLARQRALAAGPAVKLTVRREGWYRVARDELVAAGLSPLADPARLQLFLNGSEIPVRLDAARWAQGGALEFYGEGADTLATDAQVYWLVEGDAQGRRIGSPGAAGEVTLTGAGAPNIIGPPPAESPQFFTQTVERRDRTIYFSSLLNGEEGNFFGRVVSPTAVTQALASRSPYRDDASATSTLRVALQGVTAGAHHVRVLFNGAEVGVMDFSDRARREASFTIAASTLRDGDNDVQLVSSVASDVSLTDYLRLTYRRRFLAEDDRLRFNAPDGATGVRLGGFTSPDIRVADVSETAGVVELPVEVEPEAGGWAATVNVPGGGLAEHALYAFTGARAERVAGISPNRPSRWSEVGLHGADLVIITHGEFVEQVGPLAARRAQEGLAVEVVDVEDLYDEFSFGAHSAQAVKDFLALTREAWQRAPRYVLLVGDGSYDPRGHLGQGLFDLVPSKLVDTGVMETASDDWFADFDGDGLAEMAVGRLPVRTQTEASAVVQKIAGHDPAAAEPSALLVADRGGPDGYNFEAATAGVQSLIPAAVAVQRINRGAQAADVVRGQIVAGINAGPLVVNWMGHGAIDVWSGDGLLRTSDAAALSNGARLPVFVMMTCLNGYYLNPTRESLAESVLKAERGGALAVWASSGMTEPSTQTDANRELYRTLFAGTGVRLGDAVRSAKAATSDRDVRKTWVLFGDPSSRLR